MHFVVYGATRELHNVEYHDSLCPFADFLSCDFSKNKWRISNYMYINLYEIILLSSLKKLEITSHLWRVSLLMSTKIEIYTKTSAAVILLR